MRTINDNQKIQESKRIRLIEEFKHLDNDELVLIKNTIETEMKRRISIKKANQLRTLTVKLHRPIYIIAREIRKNWNKETSGTKLYFGAVPYLEAMETLNTVSQDYGCDSGKSVVTYFLLNATSWKGETAKRIKKELNAMIK